jgi:hypothetical protein
MIWTLQIGEPRKVDVERHNHRRRLRQFESQLAADVDAHDKSSLREWTNSMNHPAEKAQPAATELLIRSVVSRRARKLHSSDRRRLGFRKYI